MTIVLGLHPQFTPEHLGYIPNFLSDADPRPMREQINTAYISGWHSMSGFRMKNKVLHYPGDPPLEPIALIKMEDGRTEVAYFYPHSMLAIVQADGTFEVARLD
jgi:hypothetical protein